MTTYKRTHKDSPGVLYQSRFFADYFRQACVETHGSVAAAARKYDRPVATISRWANGGSLPDRDEDFELVAEIVDQAGLDSTVLFELELLDRLDYWRREWGLQHDQVLDLAKGLVERRGD